MVYILKNLNLRKLCISFTICFIFIIIGITHVFADEKPTITQVVMDQDVGARLDEGGFCKNERQSRRCNCSACMDNK